MNNSMRLFKRGDTLRRNQQKQETLAEDRRWHPDAVSRWFHTTAKECGIDARLHDLRHSAAIYMLNSGIQIQVVKEILGHAHLSTTRIYSHVLDEIEDQEMQKIKFEYNFFKEHKIICAE